MQKLVGYSGEGDFSHGKSMYTNSMEPVIFYSLPCKRSKVNAPFLFNSQICKKQKTTIEVLPDECLFEIFKRLNGTQERSSCASVSKHWLNLLSTIHKDKFTQSSNQKSNNGHLSRFLQGKKATDVRLAAIAVGANGHGGLGSLSINGNNAMRGVTNFGLKAISRNCPSLKDLSLWNLSSISDEGIIEIANGCHNLEKIDFCQIPISNKSLIAIAKNCPNLTELTLESCSNIGNEGLQAIGQSCRKLKSILIKNCLQVSDQGIASLLSSSSYSLKKLKLESLNVSDMSLAVIGHYGIGITELALTGLRKVTEKGFWVMGSGQGLQKLKSLTITSCLGVTDLGLEALGRGCPNLKQFSLHKCAFLSDNGIVSFAKSAISLETLLLEECHRVTQYGIFAVVVRSKLKNLTLENCFGIKDSVPGIRFPCSDSVPIESLSIRNSPGFGNNSLMLLGQLCQQLQNVEFTGLHGITDEGFAPLIECCEPGLVKVSLISCPKLTDKMVSELCKIHGGTLEVLNLDGCTSVTDSSLFSIASDCLLLTELDVSRTGITDSGVAALACAVQLSLQILSISSCRLVSDKSLPFLLKLGESLVGLNIQQCHGISNSGVGLLGDHLWNCDILS